MPVFIVKDGRIVIEGEALRRLGLKDGDVVVISPEEFAVVKRGSRRFQLGFDVSIGEMDELIEAGSRA